ncbi:hypothetical protein V8C37DRAFT_388435 [Trichoderma ceciliae]
MLRYLFVFVSPLIFFSVILSNSQLPTITYYNLPGLLPCMSLAYKPDQVRGFSFKSRQFSLAQAAQDKFFLSGIFHVF